jgi:Glycosyl transferase family group 2
MDNPLQVTGSRCDVSACPSWIERYWFKPLLELNTRYINSGHLITTRKLFNDLGGFDDQLESGEDYAFGMAASAAKALIINNPALAVIHEGYPKTLLQFARREMWHGKGDCESIQRIKSSNVALASLLFVGLNGFSILMLLFSENSLISTSGFLLAIALCVTLAVYKHGARSFKGIIVVSVLYYIYLLSRFLSCVSLLNSASVRS